MSLILKKEIIFDFFLFSYVLVCVSIDRLYAIIRPMDVRTASSGIDSNNPEVYFNLTFFKHFDIR